MCAADVDEPLEAAEVVGAGDGVVLGAGDAGHRGRERPLLVRIRHEEVEERLSEQMLKGHLSRFDAVEEPTPGAPVVVVDDHESEVPERAWDTAPERRRGGRQPEAAVRRLGEHPDARERPEHAMDERRVRADLLGDRCGRLRSLGQRVGDPELRGDEDHLRQPVAGDEVEHRLLRLRTTAGLRHAWRLRNARVQSSSQGGLCPPSPRGRRARRASLRAGARQRGWCARAPVAPTPGFGITASIASRSPRDGIVARSQRQLDRRPRF